MNNVIIQFISINSDNDIKRDEETQRIYLPFSSPNCAQNICFDLDMDVDCEVCSIVRECKMKHNPI